MFAPSAMFVVFQMSFMLPPISSVPAVDNDSDFALFKIALIFDSCCPDADVSLAEDAIASPVVAFIIALTSAADLSIVLMLRSLKSCNWLAVSDNKF